MNKKILLLLLGGVLAGFSIAWGLQQLGVIPTSFDFYTNAELTFTPSTIYWGNLTVGENSTRTINITNTGNTPVTLTATVTNASTSNFNYTLEWDAEGTVLTPNTWVLANFTFTVYNATRTGHFDIIISDAG